MKRLLAAAGIVAGLAALWVWYAVAGDRSLPKAPVIVVIERGDTLADAAARLRRAGALAQPLGLRILARVRGSETAIHDGAYRIDAHQSAADILQQLVEGRVEAAWVTIPEGFTVREIAARLAERHLTDAAAFEQYARTTGIQLADGRTRSLEGYLFPSTYLVPVGGTPELDTAIFVDQFRRELPPDAARRARALGLRISQVITVASLIEREAQADDERALMAGVYYNRLRIGMPLQVDATIEYVFPSHHTVITSRDLEVDSPYNTYRHNGLPPTPIANPGKPSIAAAFAPRSSGYLYYVYRGHGHHAFASTLQEHNANVERYLNQKE